MFKDTDAYMYERMIRPKNATRAQDFLNLDPFMYLDPFWKLRLEFLMLMMLESLQKFEFEFELEKLNYKFVFFVFGSKMQ
jgi:hypothetical protein